MKNSNNEQKINNSEIWDVLPNQWQHIDDYEKVDTFTKSKEIDFPKTKNELRTILLATIGKFLYYWEGTTSHTPEAHAVQDILNKLKDPIKLGPGMRELLKDDTFIPYTAPLIQSIKKLNEDGK